MTLALSTFNFLPIIGDIVKDREGSKTFGVTYDILFGDGISSIGTVAKILGPLEESLTLDEILPLFKLGLLLGDSLISSRSLTLGIPLFGSLL
jgi:hypothetical protein